MKSRTRAKKRRGSTDPAKKTNSELNIDYFTFLKRNSTNESYGTKDRHQKVKITSCDLFEECIISIRQKIHGILQEPKISLFCGAIDGVDELLSAFSCFSPTRNNLYGIFFDINPHKVEYFTYRLHLTQISPTLVDYMRNLLFYMKGDQGLKPETILEKSKRNQVSSEIHATHLSQLAKNTVDPRPDGSLKELRHALKRGTDILSIVRDGKTHYKNLANGLIKNMRLNPTTHWLSNEENYQKIRQACAEGRIKAIQADLNRKGKEKILNILKNTGMRPLLLYIPKGTKKFRQTQELIELFDHCIDTIPPPGKTGRYRVWHEMDPERFFTTPQFKHQGELSNKQLLHLVDEYKGRTYVQSDHNDRCSLMLLGDMPFGRIYFDDRSNSFLNKIQDYVNRYNVKNVVLCGDMIDGEHTREKRKLALLQFLSDQPKTSIEEQCQMASSFISGFKGNVYSVTSDGDWDIIEEKQREILLQKEFQYKMDKNTMHIPDEVRKSLRVEAIFEAAKEYYDYLERNIPLSEKIGDSLAINFNTAKVRITHMSLGQYFRKSLTKAVGVKEQQIINQILANHDLQEEGGITIKVSSHDNVLQAHMESDNVLNVKVPSLESSTQYESIPIQIRNAVQDMMHKAFSVRGKIPFLSSCKVEVTEDARIMLTIINEKLLDMLEKYKDRPSEEYIIFNLCDAQIGSIAYRHDYLIKYMDYVKSSSQKLQNKRGMKKVGRIALFNGDVIEGMNYPTAMMRNSPTRLVIPQTQAAYAIEVMKPFFFTEENNQLKIDQDIEHIILTHGNHEYNSGFIHSGMLATETLMQYFKGHMDRQYTPEEVKNKLMYSLFVSLDKNKMLFTSIGAFSKLGLNVHMMHSYGGRPNLATATPPQERWVTRIGPLAKPWDILIQGHYHKFSLGEVAGKVLLTFPSFTEISDFEYERGLDSPVCGTVLHLSSRYGLVIEILTQKFLDKYQCQHPMFKKQSINRFHEKCVEKAIEPIDLSKYG